MTTDRSSDAKCSSRSAARVAKYVGGASLALVAVALIANFDDIRRYIRIVLM